MSQLFPMFLKLAGKRCLVVGAGKVGEPKIGGLIDTGASIHVIALEGSDVVHGMGKRQQDHTQLRAFVPEDLDGVALAVVATASPVC